MDSIQEANRYKTLGNEAFAAKKYQEAIQHFTKAIELNREDHIFYSNRSACYASLNQYEKALLDAQVCVEKKPDWAKGYQRKGLAEFYLKKYDLAENTYKKGLELEPTNQHLIEGLQGVTEAKSKVGSGAEEKKESFSTAEEAKNKGNEEFKKKRYEQAIFYYDQAIELNSSEPIYYTNKAITYLELKDADNAIECCDKAIELCKAGQHEKSKLAKALARKAGAYALKQNYDEALGLYSESLLENSDAKVREELQKTEKLSMEKRDKSEINPDLAEQHRLKGNEVYGQGKNAEAIHEYDQAIRRDPTQARLYANRATVLMKLEDYHSALRDIDRCLELDPKYIKAYAKKGVMHSALQDYAKALEAYEKGLKEDPNNEECKTGAREAKMYIQMEQKVTGRLLTKSGDANEEILKNVQVVAYYFSAHWCPPCKKFTPLLADLYKKWNSGPTKRIEIVFISSDKDEAQFRSYYNEMPWAAVPYGDPRIRALNEKFRIEGIPSLLIVHKNGRETPLSFNGYEDVMLKQEKAIDQWVHLYY